MFRDPIKTPAAEMKLETKSEPQSSPDPKHLEDYNERVAKYKEATKDPEFTPLFKHLLYVLDAKNCSSPDAIAKVLTRMGSVGAGFKGTAIDFANAAHRGSRCPFFKNTPLNPSLHLGTTRVWNADGTVNEDRWTRLIERASEKNGAVFPVSKLLAYLDYCAANDPEEKTTGRQASSIPGSKSFQAQMAVQAFNELFARLTGGWILDEKTGKYEGYITKEVMREFFDDSPVAYLRAECGLLPAPQPAPAVEPTKRMGCGS